MERKREKSGQEGDRRKASGEVRTKDNKQTTCGIAKGSLG